MGPFEILKSFGPAFMNGLRVTLKLSAIIWMSGLVLGPILGTVAHRWHQSFGRVLRICAFLLASIPFLVLLYWAYYPFQQLIGRAISSFITASAVLSLLNV